MVACDDGSGGPAGGGGGGGGGGSGAAGTLTVTGLPDGYWTADVFPQGFTFSTWGETMFNEEAYATVQRDDRDRTFHLRWRSGTNRGKAWTESGNRPVVLFWGSPNNKRYLATVNFSNGSATVPLSSFREIDIPNI